jgi:YVTN family beta-propeller protein
MKFISDCRFILALASIVACVNLSSCDNDPDPVAPGATGYYVVNEGAFGNNNSSLSFFDRESDRMTNDVFQSVNGRALGDQAQSMTIFDGKGYIVVQNSSKIEVIDLSDNKSIKTITNGVESPRYFVGISASKGYISDWGSDGVTGTVKVINLATFEVIKTIPVGHGPNKMLSAGNRLYVANSGGFAKDNTVKVINIETDAVIASATVGDNPTSLKLDKEGNLWVAASGNLAYNQDFSINETLSTRATITKLNSELAETGKFTLTKISYGNLTQLEINPDGNILYYNYDGATYSLSTTAVNLSSTPLIPKSYYGLAVDPFTGDIIGGLTPNFSSAGTIEVSGSDGVLKKTFTVGIAPNGCAFK